MSMMMPPPIMIVHPSGVPIGTADTIQSHPEAVEASAVDPGDADHGGGADHGDQGDLGDGHDGGGDGHDALADNSDFDGGGDFGGGDGGGFDGGGFDGGGDF
jgi:hypothetical protein